MKSFYSLVFVFGVLIASEVVALGKIDKKILDECKGTMQATDNDVKIVLQHDVPQTHSGKCLLACAYEKIGIIVNGKISIEDLKEYVTRDLLDGDAIKAANDIIKECLAFNDHDICEHIAKMMDCMLKGAAKRGIVFKST